MRLIDADALKRKAQKVATESWKMKIKANVETTLNQFIDWINAAPTIEPEIVRCKDCKHRIEHKHYGDLGESAYTCEGNMDGWILPDDFCSLAERRADD